MPHRTQMQVIKRRLVGKEGGERIRELRAILGELPGYRNGPYADIRKWVEAQIEQTRVRKRVVHRDSIAVRREGAAQVALVGPPNVGKSSVLQALSEIQIRTGDYAFTTLRPVPALTRIRGVLVQLSERGKTVVDAALADLLDHEHGLLTALDDAQRKQLAFLLRMLLTPFDAHETA